MSTTTEVIEKCPHFNCGGNKVRETIVFKVNPYPPSQIILGPGGKGQMVSKTEIKIYCTKCSTLFNQ